MEKLYAGLFVTVISSTLFVLFLMGKIKKSRGGGIGFVLGIIIGLILIGQYAFR
ncbi:MAG TPA: hypothetical protein PJ988_03170 [Anaerolinea sp.]|nr:hypothetical protein [Anaerolinea sp.]